MCNMTCIDGLGMWKLFCTISSCCVYVYYTWLPNSSGENVISFFNGREKKKREITGLEFVFIIYI